MCWIILQANCTFFLINRPKKHPDILDNIVVCMVNPLYKQKLCSKNCTLKVLPFVLGPFSVPALKGVTYPEIELQHQLKVKQEPLHGSAFYVFVKCPYHSFDTLGWLAI